MNGALVTGTDTGVGKTVIAACIAAALRAGGLRVAAVKPVVTGIDEPEPGRPADHELLAAAAGVSPKSVTGHTFGPPLSPHLAAEAAGVSLDPAELVAAAHASAAGADVVIAEGVGGLLVPLTLGAAGSDDGAAAPYLLRDYARDLGLPLIIAARPGLGTINHTLLTIDSARAADLDVLGVVLTPWPDGPSAIERSNHGTIAALSGVDVDVLPLVSLAPDALASAGAALRATAKLASGASRTVAA